MERESSKLAFIVWCQALNPCHGPCEWEVDPSLTDEETEAGAGWGARSRSQGCKEKWAIIWVSGSQTHALWV